MAEREPTVPLGMWTDMCEIADLFADALRFYAQGNEDAGGFARDALKIGIDLQLDPEDLR